MGALRRRDWTHEAVGRSDRAGGAAEAGAARALARIASTSERSWERSRCKAASKATLDKVARCESCK
eukprot:13002830-Alexandrium_andersonii.AAC.1